MLFKEQTTPFISSPHMLIILFHFIFTLTLKKNIKIVFLQNKHILISFLSQYMHFSMHFRVVSFQAEDCNTEINQPQKWKD